MKNLWSGRFSQQMEDCTADYNESISFDHVLYKYSIKASIAHATMLAKQNIISEEDCSEIIRGLKVVEEKLDRGKIEFDIMDEDIMMTIEKYLTEEIGEVGKRLHTARSRNDQNVVDETLFLRDAINTTMNRLVDLMEVIVKKAEEQKFVIMPGFTHLQHAQPITVGYYYMGRFQGIKRDYERFAESRKRVNINPLGACALAGTTLPSDRFITTELLGFDRPSENGLDTIGSRDTFAEYLFNAALCMVHMSGFAEEMVVFNSQEFSYINIEDSFCTGSSIMPQKKNPDIAELVRGKAGRAIGNLVNLMVVLKGTFLTLNKDYQEDKEALFDSIHTLDRTLNVFARMLVHITFREDVLKKHLKSGFLEATDIAEYLVTKGVPFRKAHEIVGNLVKYCEVTNKYFCDITRADLDNLGIDYGLENLEQFTVENCVKNRNSFGGTGYYDVERQIANAKSFLEEIKKSNMLR